MPHTFRARAVRPTPDGTLTGTRRSMPASGSTRSARAGGRGSPCSMQDSAILRASPWAISAVSATLRPSATSPGTSTLVARKPPPGSFSMRRRIVVSFISGRSPGTSAQDRVIGAQSNYTPSAFPRPGVPHARDSSETAAPRPVWVGRVVQVRPPVVVGRQRELATSGTEPRVEPATSSSMRRRSAGTVWWRRARRSYCSCNSRSVCTRIRGGAALLRRPNQSSRRRRGRRQLDSSTRGRGEEAAKGTGVRRYLCRQRPLGGFRSYSRASWKVSVRIKSAGCPVAA